MVPASRAKPPRRPSPTRNTAATTTSSGRINGPSPTTKAHHTADLRVASTRTSSQKLSPIQPKTIPISSPEVANSQTPDTTEKTSSPMGMIRPSVVLAPSRCMARPAEYDTESGEPQAQQHGEPLEGQERKDLMGHRQQEHPQGIGVHLHPLADVENRPMAGEEVPDDAEVDEGILLHPPVAPRPDQDDHQGNGHHQPRPFWRAHRRQPVLRGTHGVDPGRRVFSEVAGLSFLCGGRQTHLFIIDTRPIGLDQKDGVTAVRPGQFSPVWLSEVRAEE